MCVCVGVGVETDGNGTGTVCVMSLGGMHRVKENNDNTVNVSMMMNGRGQ